MGAVLGRSMEDVRATYSIGKELGRGQFGVTHLCTHRGDIKPENFRLLSKAEDVPLKATDFGPLRLREVFRDIVGSAYYIAPEVLKMRYGPEADIWSVGVMLSTSSSPACLHSGQEDGDAPDTPPLDNVVLNRLKKFRAMNQFKKAALRIIAGCLSEKITRLKEMFKNIDKDNSGTIKLQELKNGLAKHGTKLSDTEIQQVMEAWE
nr:unnamed protein product [Digitaria exilis]